MANRACRRIALLLLACGGGSEDICSCSFLCIPGPSLEYLHKKKIYYTLEQPATSLLPDYKPLQASAHRSEKQCFGEVLFKKHGAKFLRLSLGAYGGSTLQLDFAFLFRICFNDELRCNAYRPISESQLQLPLGNRPC